AAIGALDTAILVVNNLRDIDTDARAGKRTLAVRLGRSGTRVEYGVLLTVAAAVPVVGVAVYGWSPFALLSLAAVIPALPPTKRVMTATDPRDLIPALGQTARFTGVYALLLAVGLSLG
nr:1,4-dihydroxy-2-naphthoate polyprenyltransferase [Actinomycetota bacterium]NIS29647.1 1,4-dihydroxy-2-naphthoate polyprenyltransferase [Actinomycetota bacterium]NIU64971.1 1,4-dihydroxy-2-naphthoate polyprenyltransferase [Actinomycetota bacterium]NIV54752.1 1,4-dihydroxy-2-naphthoate polyprenyltransferase [Actinomycetota bacterium]NIW26777.1 1,4-dihydroxy-2-naphthoate polyprenyltransferase [Actinomycetota bacterium]